MKNKRLIEIEWDDVSSFSGWVEIEGAKNEKPLRAKMVGWEISRNRDCIVLVTAFSGDDCNGRRVIPRGCIKSIRKIE